MGLRLNLHFLDAVLVWDVSFCWCSGLRLSWFSPWSWSLEASAEPFSLALTVGKGGAEWKCDDQPGPLDLCAVVLSPRDSLAELTDWGTPGCLSRPWQKLGWSWQS